MSAGVTMLSRVRSGAMSERPCRETLPAWVNAGVVIIGDVDTFGGESTAGSIASRAASTESAHVFGRWFLAGTSPYATVSRPDARLHYSRSLAKLLTILERQYLNVGSKWADPHF